jgi:hypothetical protein
MAAESIIVTNSDATTDVTFYKIFETGYKSIWGMAGLSPSGARTIELLHEPQPSNRLTGNDRHTISFKRNVPVTTAGIAGVAAATVSLTLSLPRNAEWTLALTKDLCKNLQCLLENDFITGVFSNASLSGDYHLDSFVPD